MLNITDIWLYKLNKIFQDVRRKRKYKCVGKTEKVEIQLTDVRLSTSEKNLDIQFGLIILR